MLLEFKTLFLFSSSTREFLCRTWLCEEILTCAVCPVLATTMVFVVWVGVAEAGLTAVAFTR